MHAVIPLVHPRVLLIYCKQNMPFGGIEREEKNWNITLQREKLLTMIEICIYKYAMVQSETTGI